MSGKAFALATRSPGVERASFSKSSEVTARSFLFHSFRILIFASSKVSLSFPPEAGSRFSTFTFSIPLNGPIIFDMDLASTFPFSPTVVSYLFIRNIILVFLFWNRRYRSIYTISKENFSRLRVQYEMPSSGFEESKSSTRFQYFQFNPSLVCSSTWRIRLSDTTRECPVKTFDSEVHCWSILPHSGYPVG